MKFQNLLLKLLWNYFFSKFYLSIVNILMVSFYEPNFDEKSIQKYKMFSIFGWKDFSFGHHFEWLNRFQILFLFGILLNVLFQWFGFHCKHGVRATLIVVSTYRSMNKPVRKAWTMLRNLGFSSPSFDFVDCRLNVDVNQCRTCSGTSSVATSDKSSSSSW